MGRPPRIHFPGAIYHVISQGVGGMDIFTCDAERVEFLAILADVAMKTGCSILSYCLMGNHFHLLLKIGDVPMKAVMRRLLTRYARRFNIRHNRRGHLFQARYLSKLCQSQGYFEVLLVYINNNPVDSGFVEDASAWKWSSHNQIIGPIRSTLLVVDMALSLLASDRGAARRRYLSLMRNPVDPSRICFDERPLKIAPAPPCCASLGEIAQRVRDVHGLDVSIPTRSRNSKLASARIEFSKLAAASGFSVTATAAFMKVSCATVSVAITAAL